MAKVDDDLAEAFNKRVQGKSIGKGKMDGDIEKKIKSWFGNIEKGTNEQHLVNALRIITGKNPKKGDLTSTFNKLITDGKYMDAYNLVVRSGETFTDAEINKVYKGFIDDGDINSFLNVYRNVKTLPSNATLDALITFIQTL